MPSLGEAGAGLLARLPCYCRLVVVWGVLEVEMVEKGMKQGQQWVQVVVGGQHM